MSENLLKFDDFISPTVRVIIKSKIEIILNKIYPKNTIFKNILISENLNPDAQYSLMKNPIDLNKPIIDIVPTPAISTKTTKISVNVNPFLFIWFTYNNYTLNF